MDLISRMKDGQKDAIQEGLYHTGALQRVNALVFAARNEYSDHVIVSRAKVLEKDDTCLFGYNAGHTVSDFARAYLHVMNEKKYSGSRKETLELIECKLQF